MSHFKNVGEDLVRAIHDIEDFTSNTDYMYNFVYRYGVFTSSQDEARIVALFDAETEGELETKIAKLDCRFHKYTDTLVDREFDVNQNCWYATYVILYPFDKDKPSGKFDGQNCKPLF